MHNHFGWLLVRNNVMISPRGRPSAAYQLERKVNSNVSREASAKEITDQDFKCTLCFVANCIIRLYQKHLTKILQPDV